uniref:C2H2-type domain-containing protein n=1 Tax=Heliothis virescens TaxID=7102 RepID=A0A2A4J9S1_HELVI
MACKVCYVYVAENNITTHTESHYLRYRCKLCSHIEYSNKLIQQHVAAHLSRQTNNATIKIGAVKTAKGRKKKEKDKEEASTPPKPGDLRKLLSKTSIEGYQCLECDMFFKNSRARKNHVARCHREGLQCDHCKKRFVNRTTLATHLKLHEGPLPRAECTICHKMVRVIQLKYHIQRHQNKTRYDCEDCNKTFSHLATYQAHLKYSRAHASEQVFKYPCPMCNKGYPSKQAMQDHFNYQHLGKTVHKCPICEKPIASRANVEKHLMRVHGQKKEKPRNHICQECGKAFTDKKALTQHEVIHSGDRPLSCDICQQTFKQKASLYMHRKRVHKVFPAKRRVEYMQDTVHHCKLESILS